MLQLASQALPVGGYSHSQGLEAAVESRVVRDEATLARWIGDLLEYSVGAAEAAHLLGLHAAWQRMDWHEVAVLNTEFLATRESAELRAATVQMGFSMRCLLAQLPDVTPPFTAALERIPEPTLPCVWAGTASHWRIPASEALTAYLWSWAENQVMAALKAVPLGQSTGQRVLLAAGERIALIAGIPLDALRRTNFVPMLAILSSRHETQYSRLFRS